MAPATPNPTTTPLDIPDDALDDASSDEPSLAAPAMGCTTSIASAEVMTETEVTRDARVADVVVEVDDADVVVVRVVASDDVVRDVVSATVDVVEATDDVVPVAVSRTDTRLLA